MGDTTVEMTGDGGNGNLLLAQQATLTQPATLQSLSFYVTTALGNLRLAVYDSSGPRGKPGKLLAQTASFKTASAWDTVPTKTTPLLNPGKYWLAYLPSSNDLSFQKQNNTGACYYYSHSFSSGFPTTFSTSPKSCTPTTWSFYATLVGGPPPTPTGVSFNPSSPSLPDSSTSGALISSIKVTMSDNSTFNGTLTLTSNPSSAGIITSGNLNLVDRR
jgi:hypothetical protein